MSAAPRLVLALASVRLGRHLTPRPGTKRRARLWCVAAGSSTVRVQASLCHVRADDSEHLRADGCQLTLPFGQMETGSLDRGSGVAAFK